MEKTRRTQVDLARELGIPGQQSKISKWLNGREGVTQDYRVRLKKLGFAGPWPQEGVKVAETLPQDVRYYNPGEYAAEAFLIVAEAARAGGAPLDSLDPKAVAEIVGSIADAVAQGRGEEARMRLVRKAETILQAMKK